ncbi:MAG: hypothetical protein PHG48_04910 [Eubacteriales bacterium]|nr:hypothetical protein [Eubacteriales bacterium]
MQNGKGIVEINRVREYMTRAYHIDRIVLEMSLKPFKKTEEGYIKEICRTAFRQWLPLLNTGKRWSVLLWVSDGSEILDWDGDYNREIEWARYIGCANERRNENIKIKLSKEISKPLVYMDDPPKFTYGKIKRVIEIFKETALTEYDKVLEVGIAFDPGHEFAYSDFKYKRHPEIFSIQIDDKTEIPEYLASHYVALTCWSLLHADTRRYASYAEGIPEGTPFGEFLGKQCASYLPAMGFDYVWFSNGFGFSTAPWNYQGLNFDGKRFGVIDYNLIKDKLMSFWRAFMSACPGYRVEIRGTNYGVGMDLASDCVPLKELYENKLIQFPPPNSPWGAINSDYGLEYTGIMSRISYTPGRQFPFRFYANDPWFWQNPWTDYYGKNTHDIYCPLAISRLNSKGETESPDIVEILTIDTEYGALDGEYAQEIIPHLIQAICEYPDQPGILTWLYPFREYHDEVEKDQVNSGNVFFGDWFIRNAINNGLPLNTVMSTDVFKEISCEGRCISLLKDTILVAATVPCGEKYGKEISDFVRSGGKILLYGPINDQYLGELLNISSVEGIEGKVLLNILTKTDNIEAKVDNCGNTNDLPGTGYEVLNHVSLISGGGIREVLFDRADQYTHVYAKVDRDVVVKDAEAGERIFALSRSMPEWNGGIAAWVRGSLPYATERISPLPVRQSPDYYDSTILARYMLAPFGYDFLQDRINGNSMPVLIFVSRFDNAFYFSGYKGDTTSVQRLLFPQGVPVLTGIETRIKGGAGYYSQGKAFRHECRIFVKQKDSVISCRQKSSGGNATRQVYLERTIEIYNLDNAKITIYPPLRAITGKTLIIKNNNKSMDWTGMVSDGRCVIMDGISGTIRFAW